MAEKWFIVTRAHAENVAQLSQSSNFIFSHKLDTYAWRAAGWADGVFQEVQTRLEPAIFFPQNISPAQP